MRVSVYAREYMLVPNPTITRIDLAGALVVLELQLMKTLHGSLRF